jgi:hypothetical protein
MERERENERETYSEGREGGEATVGELIAHAEDLQGGEHRDRLPTHQLIRSAALLSGLERCLYGAVAHVRDQESAQVREGRQCLRERCVWRGDQ